MTQTIKDLAIGFFIVILVFSLLFALGRLENAYTREAEVLYIQNGEVVVRDFSDNLWSFTTSNSNEYYKTQLVTLHMNMCGTDNIHDDIIEWVDIS